jgi:hypothetical protein
MPQAGRSRVRFSMRLLDFSIYLILPTALWPWDRPNLQKIWVPGIFLGVNGGRRVRLTNSSLSVCRQSRNCPRLDVPQSCGPRRPFIGIVLPFFTKYILQIKTVLTKQCLILQLNMFWKSIQWHSTILFGQAEHCNTNTSKFSSAVLLMSSSAPFLNYSLTFVNTVKDLAFHMTLILD